MPKMKWQEPLASLGGQTRSDIAVQACIEIVREHGTERYMRPALKLLRESYPEEFANLTYNSLNNHLRTMDLRTRIRAHHPDVVFAQRSIEMESTRQVRHLEAEVKAAAKQKALEDRLLELFAETLKALPPAPPLWKPPTKQPEITETIVSLVSDIHGFEHVSAERMRGHNVYTPEVMCQRIANMVAAELSIISALKEGGWHFPHRVVALLGDNISGTIHELEKHAHGYNVVLACDGVAYLLAQYLREVARMHERVYVVGVSGNHGRLEARSRKQYKEPTRTWDYVIYLMVRHQLKDQLNIEFLFPDAWSAQLSIEGREFLFNHGDDIKSYKGIPWYGIERKTNRVVALEAARKNIVHYQVFGHFHSPGSTPNPVEETFINGCVIGGTEYGLEGLGLTGHPSQWMLQVHRDFGVTARWPLRLDIDRENAPEFMATPWEDVQRRTDAMGVIPRWVIGEGS